MAFLVNITSRAEGDLAHLYWEINAGHSGAALKWYRGLKEAILSLQERPNRGPITHQRDHLRHLLHGRKPHIYRVIFRVSRNKSRSKYFTFATLQDANSSRPISAKPRNLIR